MAEMLTARLIKWDAEKGYGFLQLGSQSIFLHIRDFAVRQKAPEVGDLIRFSMGTDRTGRTCARDAAYSGTSSSTRARPSLNPARSNDRARLTLAHLVVLIGLLVAPALALHKLALHPGVTIVSAVGLSVITYLIFALDKMCARANHWRIPEATLHFLALAGGWPGAFVAQQRLRHKCSKTRFQIVFWLTVLTHQFVAVDYLLDWKLSLTTWRECAHWLGH